MHLIKYDVKGDGSDFLEKKKAAKRAILDLLDSQIAAMVDHGGYDGDAISFMALARMGMNFQFTASFPDVIAGESRGDVEINFHLDHTGAYVERERKRHEEATIN